LDCAIGERLKEITQVSLTDHDSDIADIHNWQKFDGDFETKG